MQQISVSIIFKKLTVVRTYLKNYLFRKNMMVRVINHNYGFTLVEVMIAILVLSIALLGLASMATTAITSNSYSKKRTIAITLAQDKLEDLKEQAGTTTLSPANNTTENNLDENGVAGNGDFTRVVTITGGAGQLTTLNVSVSWQDFTNHTITQTTLIRQ